MKLKRRDAGNPDLVIDFLASLRHGRPREWVLRPCAFDRCSAKHGCTWRFRFSGTRSHYCVANDALDCPHRHRAWMRSMPLMFREVTERTPRFSGDPVTREVCGLWVRGVIEAMKGDDFVSRVAKVLNGMLSWSEVDTESEVMYPKLDRNERRVRMQHDLAEWVAAYADARMREKVHGEREVQRRCEG